MTTTRKVESVIVYRGEDVVSAIAAKIEKSQQRMFDKAQRGAKKTTSAFEQVKKVTKEWATPLNQATELLSKMGRVVDEGYDAVVEGAKFNDLKRATADFTGDTERSLNQLRIAVHDTIDDMSLLQQANTMQALGIETENAAAIMNLAMKASIATGQEMDFMVESLSAAIARQSSARLDNAGIVMSNTEAEKMFADALGMTASQMDDTQKKAAFLYGALKKGQEIFADIDPQESQVAALKRVTTAYDNFKLSLKASAAEYLVHPEKNEIVNQALGIHRKKVISATKAQKAYARAIKAASKAIEEQARVAGWVAGGTLAPTLGGYESPGERAVRQAEEQLRIKKALEKRRKESERLGFIDPEKKKGGGGGGERQRETVARRMRARVEESANELIESIQRHGLQQRQRIAAEEQAWLTQLADWRRENMLREVEENNAAQEAKIEADWKAFQERKELKEKELEEEKEHQAEMVSIVGSAMSQVAGITSETATRAAQALQFMWASSSPEAAKQGISGLFAWGAAALEVLGLEAWAKVAYHTAEGIAALIPPGTNVPKAMGHFAAAGMYTVTAARAGRGGAGGGATVGGGGYRGGVGTGFGYGNTKEVKLGQVGGEAPIAAPTTPKHIVMPIYGDIYMVGGSTSGAPEVAAKLTDVLLAGRRAGTAPHSPWEGPGL